MMKFDMLRIQVPVGKTLTYTHLLLLLICGISECIARSEFFRQALTPPRMGSRHSQLGYKLTLLDDLTRKSGRVDCIMLGSSIVDHGFNPSAFETAYRVETGQNINCFNFGIDASTAASTAALTKIVVDDYHPRFLIIGTDARDYAVPREDRDPAVVLNTPWVAHRQGDFSLEGWLLDNSYLYRYRQHLGRLARFQFDGTLWSNTKTNEKILPNGFSPLSTVSTYINNPPSPGDDSFEVTYYSRIYSPYHMLQENLESLESIVEYNQLGIPVILVEMPVADGLYYFFGNGESDYNQFLTIVGEVSNRYQVPFWQTEPLDFIPDNGWADYSHLNKTGAELFSSWLGKQVGKAELQGSIKTLQP